jgi:IclR family mhp operon transcriptional activator
MPSYPPVQSVVRAFGILHELNQRHVTTVDHLHKATRLPKPTIVRLLETLIGEGFVTTDKRLGGYCVTSSVQALSAGYHGGPLVVEAGRAWCMELTHNHKWPASIAVLDGTTVAVRFSTIPDSPISPFHATLNMRLSLLKTGLGRAYLASCPDKERAILTKMLRSSGEENGTSEEIETAIKELTRRVRRQGYAERDPLAEPKSSSTVAMPVRYGERVLGTVGLTYFKSAVHGRDIQRALVTPLREAVHQIERSVAELIQETEVSL